MSVPANNQAQIEQQIRAKYADDKFMKIYTNKRDPGHKAAVEEMQRLFQMKAPKS